MMTVANLNLLKKGGLSLLFVNFLMSLSGQIIVPVNGCSPIENFDNSNSWTFGGANSTWIWDNPDKLDVSDDLTIGGKALILGGNTTTSTYNQNEDSWAESPMYDLTNSNNPYVSFGFYWSSEGGGNDSIWLQYSTNNGASWLNLSIGVGTGVCLDQNWYNYTGYWGGNNGGCSSGLGGPNNWLQVRKCVAILANESNVKFRFRFVSDAVCESYGATIDEFKVCDAGVTAQAAYECTSQNLEIQFFDESFDCPSNWFWDFGDGNSSTDINPVHTYAAAGLYTVNFTVATNVMVTNGCGGPHQDTYTFNVEVMDITINNQTDVSCAGLNDGAISLNVIGAGSGTTINWIPTPGAGQGTASVTSLIAGNYKAIITSGGGGCVDSAIFIIMEPPSISANFTATDVSCPNICDGSIDVNITSGQGPFNVIWNPGNLIGNTHNSICPNSYDISIEDANGCFFNETNVAMVDAPVLPEILNLSDTIICQGEQVDIKDFEFSSSTGSISWNVIGGIDIGFGTSGQGDIPNFSALTVNSVMIEVIPQLNTMCIGEPDTFNISITTLPVPNFTTTTLGNCEPLEVTFNVIDPSINSNYTWQIGNQEDVIIGSIINYEFLAGTHSITLNEKTINNCEGTISKLDLIDVSARPKADFSFSPQFYEEGGTEINFVNESLNANTYFWTIADTGLASMSEDVVFKLVKNGKDFYKIQLIAENDEGCMDFIEKYIKLRESEIFYIPNAFTPYDGGFNNEFKPIIHSGINIYAYQLIIFNRWGEIVFISNDPEIGWNGRLKNGERVLSGTYTYKIDYQNLYKDNPKDVIGSFILVD